MAAFVNRPFQRSIFTRYGAQIFTPDKSGEVPGFVVPEAVYLPNVGTAAGAAYFARRVVPAYGGPLYQIQRASDSAVLDIPQDSKGLADISAATTWANGSQVRLRTVYDQSGNARNLTQTDWAKMPLFDLAGQRGQAAAFGAFKAMVFDGWLDVPAGNVRRPKSMTIPATVTYQYQGFSIFLVFEPGSAIYNDVYFSLKRSAANEEAMGAGTSSGINGVYTSGGGNQPASGRRARQQYQVMGFISSASAFKFLQDDQIVAGAAKWSDPLAGGVLGDSLAGSSDFLSSDNFLGFVLYPAALSDANVGLVKDALNSTFGIAAPSGALVVGVGDSIWYGPKVKESLEGRTPTRLMAHC